MTAIPSTVARPPAAPSSAREALSRVSKAILRNRKATLGLVMFLVLLFAALFPDVITSKPWNESVVSPDAVTQCLYDAAALGKVPNCAQLPPTWPDYPLGTTQLNYDVLSQLVHATGVTLFATLLISLLVTAISVVIGITAAYAGGRVDMALSLTTDVFLVIPALPLLIVLSTYLASGGIAAIVFVMTITSWAFGARQLRAQGLSIRSKEFLEAARVRGERRWYVIFAEILPNMLPLIVAAFLGTSVYVVATMAGLQFLGFGNVGDTLTWGTMIYQSQQAMSLESGNLWWLLSPIIAVAFMGTSFALLNYAFDEIANPALRKTHRRRRGKPAA
jgi:peptide/nickel transport system permease protein